MKTLNFIAPALLCASTFLFLCACSNTGNVQRIYHEPGSKGAIEIAKMDQIEKDKYVRLEKDYYFSVANDFIVSAQQADLETMLQLTSPLTLNEAGKKPIEQIYTEQVIPAFKGTTISWENTFEIISDETGNRGVVISGAVAGTSEFTVYVTVMKENGDFVVISINRSQEVEPSPAHVREPR